MNSLECSTQAERYATQECHTELVDQAKNASSRHIACSERMVPHASPIHGDAERSTLTQQEIYIQYYPYEPYVSVSPGDYDKHTITVPDLEDKS
jgi:hypothetical protein